MPDKTKDEAKRRMQANPACHAEEHDETPYCMEDPACVPVAAQPETAPVSPTAPKFQPNRFICGHGDFAEPCKICQGNFHNAVFDPVVPAADPAPSVSDWKRDQDIRRETLMMAAELAVVTSNDLTVEEDVQFRCDPYGAGIAAYRKQLKLTANSLRQVPDPAPSVTSPIDPNDCEVCGWATYFVLPGMRLHTINGSEKCPDKHRSAAPAENSVSPARKIHYLRDILDRIARGYQSPATLAQLALDHEWFDDDAAPASVSQDWMREAARKFWPEWKQSLKSDDLVQFQAEAPRNGLALAEEWRDTLMFAFVAAFLARHAPKPVSELMGALRRAAEESWAIKNGLMEVRDATELSPDKEEWIQQKLRQWGVSEETTPAPTPGDNDFRCIQLEIASWGGQAVGYLRTISDSAREISDKLNAAIYKLIRWQAPRAADRPAATGEGD